MSIQKDQTPSQQRVLQAFADMRARLETYERARTEPIAIIGAACRFPGDADSLESFWQLLREGRDTIREVPDDRWDGASLDDPDAEEHNGTRLGAFLSGDPGAFDARFFEITPREAANMDPQQRLLLEVAWEALENAGLPAEQLQGKPVGIFVGSFNNDYLRLQVTEQVQVDAYGLLGTMPSTLAGRLAYLLGTQGPTMHVDTACSSALVALHLACQSLRQGECNLALVGSVSLMLTPEPGIYLSRMQVLAPDGHCKTFDAKADGFARGEGCGVVALKPLSAALAANDPIIALIRGSAVNHDGRSNGLTAPNSLAQQELLRAALRNAGVRPDQIQYIEAHGTGTALGDPIELQALGAVMGEGHEAEPLLIGSVKTNVGHLEPVAGIVGLFKAMLALRHETIPPHLHLQTPNPYIPWDELPFRVPQTCVPWPRSAKPRLAGISSFGLTGTNAHVIIEEAPLPQGTNVDGSPPSEKPSREDYLLPLSARSSEALRALVQSYQAFLETEPEERLADICYTASLRRSQHAYRTYVAGASRAELRQQFAALHDDERFMASKADELKGLVFVFPGHGSQWAGMGRQLYAREPVFRAAIERCDQAMRAYVPWSLIMELHRDDPQEQLVVIQLLIFAVQVALVDLWRSWGIQPAAVIGHSMGEIAGLHIAGVLTLDDAIRIIYHRGLLLQSISGRGSMALVGLPEAETRAALTGYETRLAVAGSNSERSTLISGDVPALEDVMAQLSARGIFCSRVKIDFASHSPQIDALRAELLQRLGTIQPRDCAIAIYSTVTGQILQGHEADADYWLRNVRQPVQFARAIHRLREHGYHHFLEISAHPILLSAIEEGFQQHQQRCVTLPSLRRGEEERRRLLHSLGALYAAGYLPAWSAFYDEKRTCVQLPNYPWQREHFWLEKGRAVAPVSHGPARSSAVLDDRGFHPLLGRHMTPALHPGTHYWEQEISMAAQPFLADHLIQESVVFPGAAYMEMALSAARWLFGPTSCVLSEVHFEELLFLRQQESQRTQLVLVPLQEERAAFCILSSPVAQSDRSAANSSETYTPDWTQHASGIIRRTPLRAAAAPGDAGEPTSIMPAEVRARCTTELSGKQFYTTVEILGLRYGPGFQGIEHLWLGATEALARLNPHDYVKQDLPPLYTIHPALLDACAQSILPLIMQMSSAEGTYLPTGVDRLSVSDLSTLADRWHTGQPLWSYARLYSTTMDSHALESLAGDISLIDDQGQVLLTMQGMHFTALEMSAATRQPDNYADWYYALHWQSQTPDQDQGAPEQVASAGNWLLLADQNGVNQSLLDTLEARGAHSISVTPGSGFVHHTDQRYQVRATVLEDWQRLLKAVAQHSPLKGIIFLWSLEQRDGTDAPALSWQQSLCGSVVTLIQALAQVDWRDLPRVWLVTREAQQPEQSQDNTAMSMQSTLWGLGRTIAYEQPRLQCTLVDISAAPSQTEVALLSEEVLRNGPEDQIALRGERRYVARLQQHQFSLEKDRQRSLAEEPLIEAGELPLRLETTQPGLLDHLRLRATSRRPLEAGEIEIEVHAAGLNFLDVLKAMGVYPGQEPGSPRLGVECAGRITRLGENVTEFQPGDEVIAIAPETFRSFVITPAQCVFPKPASLSFEKAAAVSMVFLTAYYALVHPGRLGRDERILIHSAAGGTGLAAVQIAQRLGAEIFATAGTEEKRAYLRELGVKHVLDSRSLAFVQYIREATGGAGIDVVLNSLTGEAAEQSLALLRPFGRYLEISKKDIYAQGHLALAHFRKNLSYTTIDVAGMLQQRPDLLRSLLSELLPWFADGQLFPPPVKTYALANVQEAFSTLAQGKHIGKIVVSFQRREALQVLPEQRMSEDGRIPTPISAEGTYLLSGGLGALGLRVATWLVERGARSLILVGRHAPSTDAQTIIAGLRQHGAQVEVALADVASRQELADVLQHAGQQLPPLRGVLHLAARLHDGTLTQLPLESFHKVLAPKLLGAWHLHTLTREIPLDFFVLFSSVASLLGSPGQGNYAAANAFLDELAGYRHRQGLPALSINWGPWAEIGMASAQDNRGQRLAGQGLLTMPPEQALARLERLLQAPMHSVPPSLGVMAFNLRQWRQATAYGARSALFEQLMASQGAASNLSAQHYELRDRLEEARTEDRRALLEAELRESVKRILRLSAARVDAHATLKAMGFDSLMAVELRNLLENATGLTLPTTLIWQYPTLAVLTEHLAEKMQLALTRSETDIQHDIPESTSDEKDENEIRQSSPDEVAELLNKELDDLSTFLN